MITLFFSFPPHLNSSETDCQAWIHDIKESAITLSQQPNHLQSSLVSKDLLDKIDSALSEHWKSPCSSIEPSSEPAFERMQCSHTNTIVHVCWQRNCSISAADYRYALTVSYTSLHLCHSIAFLQFHSICFVLFTWSGVDVVSAEPNQTDLIQWISSEEIQK